MEAQKDTGQLDGIELRHDSVITHVDVDQDDGYAWQVLVDGKAVATFRDSEEDLAEDARGKLERRVRKLAKRATYVQALRDIADFIDEHPEVLVDDGTDYLGPAYYTLSGQPTREEFLAAVEVLDARLHPAPHAPNDLVAVREFGPIRYEIRVPRALVCEERQVTVTELVLPDALASRQQKAA